MRFRPVGTALLNESVVILFVSTVAAVASVFAWTGPTLGGGLTVAAVVLLAAGGTAFKVYTLLAQAENREQIARLMDDGRKVLRTAIIDSPGVGTGPGAAPTPRPEDVAAVEGWIAQATDFVVHNHPWFLSRFLSDANLFTAGSIGKHYEFEQMRDRIEFRLARLAELHRQA